MGIWLEVLRLGGTVVVLGLIGMVLAVSLIFEAAANWPVPAGGRARPERLRVRWPPASPTDPP